MIGKLVAFALANRVLVLVLALALALVGARGYLRLPIDAVPDITTVQVQVLTSAPGLSPLEVESLVSRPIELALTGLPGAEAIRSVSRTAVSAVTIVFREDVELPAARALVAERLAAAREAIPASAGRPQMGPMSTGLGEVYHFTLVWPGHDARALRQLLDWQIARELKQVPGVVEVNGWGGDERAIEVKLRPRDLDALGVKQDDVERALLGAGRSAGGGAIERGEEQVLVRLDGRYRSLDDVGMQVVAARAGAPPVLVRDVATLQDGALQRFAAATADGDGETQYAMVQMIAGGNAHEVVAAVKDKLAAIEGSLPKGVEIKTLYDRAAFVDRVLDTVWHSLGEGAVAVVLVLFVCLGDLGAGLVVAAIIPLAMLGAFACMNAAGLSGNLMSLGAIDFGLVVDGAVVVVEGALAAMAVRKIVASDALASEARTFGRPVAFGVLLIGIVYVPVLALEGVEGKMFRPMALTVLFALGTALVLTFTLVPVLASFGLRRAHEHEPRFIAVLRRLYWPVLDFSLDHRRGAIAVAVALVAVGVLAGSRLGADFVPRLDEGDLVVQLTRPPSVSLAEAIAGTTQMEKTLRAFPEVRRVVARTGSPDVATDIMGVEQSDVFVLLRPRSTWTTAKNREELIAAMDTALRRDLPGATFGFTQPIEMRMQELIGGARSDIGVKVFGEDLATVRRLGARVADAMAQTQGSADVRVEPSEGLPVLTVRPDPIALGRLGVPTEELTAGVEAMRGGREVGVFDEGEKRFPIILRVEAPPPSDPAALAKTRVALGGGRVASLGDLARVSLVDAPAQLSREGGRRRLLVECNVRGRDLGGFVRELRKRLDAIDKAAGYSFVVTGQAENLARATSRLAVLVPLTLLAVFGLLAMTFGATRPALLILSVVPVAASGGLVALALRGLPFSVSAAVGFIALFGVATMNGVVLLSAIRSLRAEHDDREASRRGAHQRLRPVLTTALVASIGFVPMALATGTGAEVQRPLATVVIGGLVSATILTLLLLPSIAQERRRAFVRARDEVPAASSS